MYVQAKSASQVVRFNFSQGFSGFIDIGIGNLEKALCTYLENATPYVLADPDVWAGVIEERVISALSGMRGDHVRLVRGGEALKSFEMWRATLDWMHEAGVRRRDVLLVVGGGSVIDMGGFAAVSYLRGTPYVNVPTTLLAQADAAVGGKVAINSTSAKNSIGAFHHPTTVITDITLLSTLSKRDLSAGLAECVKVSAAQPSAELFRYMAGNAVELLSGNEFALLQVVTSAIEEKLRLLAPDPFETNLARVLNFGHTIGHAMETADRYETWRHGEAVAVGMATACRVAMAMGLTGVDTYRAFRNVLGDVRLPLDVPVGLIPRVVANLDGIRKVRDGRLNYVVPTAVGDLTILDEVDIDLLVEAMRERTTV